MDDDEDLVPFTTPSSGPLVHGKMTRSKSSEAKKSGVYVDTRLFDDHSEPSNSEVEDAVNYHITPYRDSPADADSDSDEYSTNIRSGGLLPLPVTQTRERRSSSLISLQTINLTLNKLRREIADRYKSYSDILRKNAKSSIRPTEIYYSVFKPVAGIEPIDPEVLQNAQFDEGDGLGDWNNSVNFAQTVSEVKSALIRHPPRRIAAGSSGSYFVRDKSSKIVAVFKPKDEEPYGPLSPKWTKWLHRNLFPCFFGRSCLIPNNGYIAEAAASLLDQQLRTNIVPWTDAVELASDSFYYGYFKTKQGYPKIGSFQIFLHGYIQASDFLYKHPPPDNGGQIPRTYRDDDTQQFEWTQEVVEQFREELEKLVILDYLMRNTDRGLDNWMIKLDWKDDSDGKKRPHLRIGAIDSGLAFPWKHPDEWRSYPFGWLFLPMSLIGKPFSQKTKDHFLPILLSTKWWQETHDVMRELFERDAEFKERMWKKQWAVLKGQAFNVVETLKTSDQGPLELARRQRVMVWDDEMEVPIRIPATVTAINTPLRDDELTAFPSMEVAAAMQPSSPVHTTTKPSSSNNTKSPNFNSRPGNRARRGSLQQIEQRYRRLEHKHKGATASSGDDHPHQQQPVPSQSMWSELVAEEDEVSGGDSHNTHTAGNIGLSYAEDATASAAGEQTVIVERLQTVRSKPPVFTWW